MQKTLDDIWNRLDVLEKELDDVGVDGYKGLEFAFEQLRDRYSDYNLKYPGEGEHDDED